MIRAALCVAALALAGPAHAQLGHGTLGKSQPSLYWGAVAGPTEVPYQKDTIILAAMSRAPEWANDGVSQIEVVLPDFIYAGTGWAASAPMSRRDPLVSRDRVERSGHRAASCPRGRRLSCNDIRKEHHV